MKKILMILSMMLIILTLATTAFAQNDNAYAQQVAQATAAVQGQQVQTQMQEQIQLQIHKSEIDGLENAQLRVRNEEQKQHLEMVMEKIQTQAKDRLNNFENLIIEEDENGEVEASGTAKLRLFNFLPINARVQYRITEDGNLIRNQKWYDRFLTFPQNVQNIEVLTVNGE